MTHQCCRKRIAQHEGGHDHGFDGADGVDEDRVQGIVLCTAVGFILMNLLADIAYVPLNPRLRATI
jgi:hypothetical protein